MNAPEPSALTLEKIVAGIRSGGYPHVAAQAWGVPSAVFEDWMRRGAGPHAVAPYAEFAAQVIEAHAQARLRAEMEAFQKDPKAWLANGPGRESGRRAGWSAAVKAADAVEEKENVFTQPDVIELLQTIATALEAFPEARARVLLKVQELEKSKTP